MFSLIPRRRRNELAANETHPLQQLRGEFDTLFNRFFGDWLTPFEGGHGWGLEVEEKDDLFIVRAEAPGFEPEDFDVQLTGELLTIRAEKETKPEGDDKNYAFASRRLQRTVQVPHGTDLEKVEAKYRNGILELHLPKSPEAQGKRITVTS